MIYKLCNCAGGPVSFKWSVLASSPNASPSPLRINNNMMANNPSALASGKTQIPTSAVVQPQVKQGSPLHATPNAMPSYNSSSVRPHNVQPTENQTKILVLSAQAAATGESQFSGTSDYEFWRKLFYKPILDC